MSTPLRVLHLADEAAVRRELERIACDPEGVRRMAGKGVQRCVKVASLECRQANILKQEMLALGGDAGVARGSVSCTVSASDVILFGSVKQLSLLPQRLKAQPFGLKKLAGELERLLERFEHPASTLYGQGVKLELNRPHVMGVLNLTPDSFSDGGVYLDLDAALKRVGEMVDEGADLIDVGGESTRPGAPEVSIAEELERTMPVIEAIKGQFDIPLSLDTTKGDVAREGLALGVEFINDISGLTSDPGIAEVVAEAGAGLFVMHTPAPPQSMQDHTEYDDLLGDVILSLGRSVDKAMAAGVPAENLSVDPGIGFGKTVEGNLSLIKRLPELLSLGRPILLGTSRKSFIGKVLKQDEPQRRGIGTLATVVLGVQGGARLFRVHDVAVTREAAQMAWAVCNERLPEQ